MSYYDNPATHIHARIASERSAITDLRYTYSMLLRRIVKTPIDQISVDLLNQQVNIIRQIQEKNTAINMLEAELTLFDTSDDDIETLLALQEASTTEATTTEATTTEATTTEATTTEATTTEPINELVLDLSNNQL